MGLSKRSWRGADLLGPATGSLGGIDLLGPATGSLGGVGLLGPGSFSLGDRFTHRRLGAGLPRLLGLWAGLVSSVLALG